MKQRNVGLAVGFTQYRRLYYFGVKTAIGIAYAYGYDQQFRCVSWTGNYEQLYFSVLAKALSPSSSKIPALG